VVWKDWSAALDADPVLARQLLRKVLVGPILVLPKGRGAWEFLGGSRFDALLHGALTPRADAVRAWSPAVRARQAAALRAEFPAADPLGASAWPWPEPIAGGSDAHAGGGIVRSTDMAPHTHTRGAPQQRRGAPRFRDRLLASSRRVTVGMPIRNSMYADRSMEAP